MSYENRSFRSITNSGSGGVGGDTIFHYHQDGTVWGEYSGGEVVRGTLIAKILPDDSLDMRYQHVIAAANYDRRLYINSRTTF